jgi:ligand-binding SRPBCC domain-containing protein
MKVHKFKTEQLLHTDEITAWRFFSDPANLARITPPYLQFVITRIPEEKGIRTGTQIEYIVRPLFGIPLKWKTKITAVDELKSFTDTQLKGPYKLWEHTHEFEKTPGGILMKDIVRYALPFGILGDIMHALMVRNKIREIFSYRREVLDKLFNSKITAHV